MRQLPTYCIIGQAAQARIIRNGAPGTARRHLQRRFPRIRRSKLNAARIHVYHVERRGGADIEPIVVVSAKAQVRGSLRQHDTANHGAIGRQHSDAIRPAARAPDVPVLVAADVVGETSLRVAEIVERFAVGELAVVRHLVDPDQ
jgi:hypothetical protein